MQPPLLPIALTLALLVTLATARLIRPALSEGEALVVRGPGFILVAGVFALAILPALLLGPLFGLALFASFGLIALGRRLGQRMTERPGHEDDLTAFFIEMMGPALLLAPMAVSHLVAGHLARSEELRQIFLSLALGLGGAGLIALFPLWPLPGGRALAVLARGVRPGLEKPLSWAMIWALTLFALQHGLILFAALGAVAGCLAIVWPMIPFEGPGPAPLPRGSRLLAWGAYLAMSGAYLLSGWWILVLIASV